MDTERCNQADLIRHYVEQASCLRDSLLAELIIDAISNPNLFTFAEILSVPSVALLDGTEHSKYLNLLRLFAFGTWRDYKDTITATKNPDKYLPLAPEQVLKLKQLSVLSATKQCKVLSYDLLMPALDISTVRELEDFLIDSCISVGIVKGELIPSLGCIEVDYAAARDPSPNQLRNILAFYSSWPSSVDKFFASLEERVGVAKGKEEEVQEYIELTNGKEDEDAENKPKKLQSHERQADQEDAEPEPKRMKQKTP